MKLYIKEFYKEEKIFIIQNSESTCSFCRIHKGDKYFFCGFLNRDFYGGVETHWTPDYDSRYLYHISEVHKIKNRIDTLISKK